MSDNVNNVSNNIPNKPPQRPVPPKVGVNNAPIPPKVGVGGVNAPVKPTPPVKPTAPVKPDVPVKPTEPVKPVAPVKPTPPVKPTAPVKPDAPVKSDVPVKPTEPVKPEKIVQVEPNNKVPPVKPNTNKNEPQKVVEPIKEEKIETTQNKEEVKKVKEAPKKEKPQKIKEEKPKKEPKKKKVKNLDSDGGVDIKVTKSHGAGKVILSIICTLIVSVAGLAAAYMFVFKPEPKEYTITYLDIDLQTVYQVETVIEGERLDSLAPYTSSDPNLDFKGWYLEDTYENLFDPDTVIQKDYVLYPKFKYEYTITYMNANDSTYKVKTFDKDEIVILEEGPQKPNANAIFRGWYIDSEYTTKFNFGEAITRSYTLYPLFEYEYKITYKNADLSSVYTTQILDEDDVTVAPSAPSHISPYAVFKGWYTDTTFTNKFTFGTTVTENHTLYPLFEYEYKITYKGIDLTTTFQEVIYDEDDITVMPTALVHPSQYAVFKGWYTTTNFTNKFTFGTTINQSYTLYPLFELEYKITYKDVDLVTDFDSQIYNDDEITIAPASPLHSNPYAVFKGWYSDSDFTTKFTFGETINQHYTLYPLYSIEYTIKYIDFDLINEYKNEIYTQNQATVEPASPTHTSSYAIFRGWYTDSTFTTKFTFGTTINKHYILYPLFEKEYKITYKGLDLTSDFKVEVYIDDDVTVELTPPTHDDEYAVFKGWFEDNNFETEFEFGTSISKHYTLYPKFVNEYKITYKSIDLISDYLVEIYNDGEVTIEPNAPTHGNSYAVFKGWYTSNNFTDKFNFGGEINRHYTLYPLFECLYEIVYKDVDLITDYKTETYNGEEVTIEPNAPTNANEYAVFKGWYSDSTFENAFTFGSVLTKDYVLYPLFVIEYKITYKNIDLTTDFEVEIYGQDDVTVENEPPTHENSYAVFKGWFVDSNFENEFEFGSSINQHYTLYPKFVNEYKIIYKAIDLINDYLVVILNDGDVTEEPIEPTHESEYAVFRGWYSDSTFENKFTFGTTISEHYTLYPYFETEYTVEYKDVDLVTSYKEETYQSNEVTVEPLTPTHSNSYAVFKGWYREDTFENLFTFGGVLTSDVVLYPLFVIEYKITYKTSDLTTDFDVEIYGVDDVTIEKEPPTHSNSYAVFKGWFEDSNFETEFVFGTNINQHYTLYPKFVNEYKIIYKAIDLITEYLVEIYNDGEVTVEPTAPTHEDEYAVFRGWYSDSTFENKFTFGTTISEHYILYPYFENEYDIEFKNADLTTTYKKVTYLSNEGTVEPLAPTNANSYAVFKGWYTDTTFKNQFTFGGVLTSDIVLYPLFVVEYKIYYKNIDLTSEFKVETYGENDLTVELGAPLNPNQYAVFKGWYTSTEFTTKFNFGTTINTHYTLYPKFEVEYTITYKASDLTSDYKVEIYNDGEATVEPSAPTHSNPNAVFRGWYLDSNFATRFTFGLSINKHYTLYPKFEIEYTITYKASDFTTNYKVETYVYNEVTVEPTNPTHENEYAVFKGWYRENTFGSEFTFGSVLTSDITLYPLFVIEYKLTYKNIDLTSDYKVEVYGVDDLTVESNAPTHSSQYAVFKGWYTDSSFNNPFEFGTTINTHYTLYPKFEIEYRITYKSVDLTSDYKVEIYNAGEATVEPSAPTHSNPNAVLRGWYLDSSFTTKFTFGSSINKHYTLYPKFEIEYTITYKASDFTTNYKVETYLSTAATVEPVAPSHLTKTADFGGWYLDTACNNPFIFGSLLTSDITLYPLFENFDRLAFTPIKDGEHNIIAYSVAQGEFSGSELTIPSTYKRKPVTQVTNSGFRDNVVLEKVVFPNCITLIDIYAFLGCTNLNVDSLPSELLTLNSDAFSGCTSLTLASLPSKLTKIGLGAFRDCTLLALSSLPSSITEIGGSAFSRCENITLTSLPSGLTVISGYAFLNCKKLALTSLPSGLTSVGNSAFDRCEKIKLTSLPSGLETIGDYAFMYCRELALTSLPDSVTSIGKGAFNGCSKLALTYLPDSLTKIEDSVFVDCGKLAITTIPSSIMSIGDYSFSGCSGLTTLTLPSNLVSIGELSFQACTNLEFINLPSGLTSVGDGAFRMCFKLKLIEIPNTISSFGTDVFEHCSVLSYILCYSQSIATALSDEGISEETIFVKQSSGYSSLSFAETIQISSTYSIKVDNTSNYKWVKANGRYYRCMYSDNPLGLAFTEVIENDAVVAYSVAKGSFSGSELTIPESYREKPVTKITDDGFKNMSSLRTVNLPNSITEIGDYGFYNCYALSTINVSTSLVSIGEYAFRNAPITTFEMPNTVTTIGKYAFQYCYELTTVKLSNKVTVINDYTFYYCSKLQSIELPSSVNTIGNHAFSMCSQLQSIELPSSVNSIGNYAFASCGNVEYLYYDIISLSTNFTYNNSPFYGLSNTSDGCEIVIGKNVTSLPEYIFSNSSNYDGDKGVTKITYENGCQLTTIGRGAFSNAKALESITILPSVTSIGNYAFDAAYNLKTIYYNAINLNNLEDYNEIFSNAGKDSGGVIVTIGNKVQRIPYNLFNSYSDLRPPNITEVKFEANSVCTTIGKNSFEYCYRLHTITIPSSVKTIENGAFYNCTTLQNVKLSEGLTTIDGWVFYNCEALSTITLPSTLTTIGYYAFNSCYSLIEVINKSTLQLTKGSYDYGWVAYYALGIVTSESASKIKTTSDYIFYVDGATNTYLVNYKGSATSITLPDYYNGYPYTIYKKAFNVSSIESITLPNTLLGIADNGFYYCDKLTSINIPSSVTYIGKGIFQGCYNLETITVSDSNSVFKDGDANLIVEKATNKLYAMGCKGTIPNYILSCEERALTNYANSRLVIPGNIKELPYYLVSSDYIETVVVEEGVERVDTSFYDCDNIDTIIFASSVTYVEDLYMVYWPSILSGNEAVAARLQQYYHSDYSYLIDTTTDFTNIEFDTSYPRGDINGRYNDGTNYWVRIGEEGNYKYYKQYKP